MGGIDGKDALWESASLSHCKGKRRRNIMETGDLHTEKKER